MSFELILPFLRPIEGLLLDDSISEIMGNPDSSWWCERDGKMHHEDAVSFDAAKLLTGLEVIANQLGKSSMRTIPRCTRSFQTEAGWRLGFHPLCGHPQR
jgi:Flp pilus assembly CpaF family ATPase